MPIWQGLPRLRLRGGHQLHRTQIRSHPAALAPSRQRQMFDHRIKKRRQPRTQHKTGKLAMEIEKRLLHDIQRIGLVAAESLRQPRHPISVAVVKRLESGRIAAVEGINQLLVSARV